MKFVILVDGKEQPLTTLNINFQDYPPTVEAEHYVRDKIGRIMMVDFPNQPATLKFNGKLKNIESYKNLIQIDIERT